MEESFLDLTARYKMQSSANNRIENDIPLAISLMYSKNIRGPDTPSFYSTNCATLRYGIIE